MVKIDKTFENNLIKIGENQSDNDKILSEANQNDFWFHLADFPSCHVILSCSDDYEPTKQMINYAATLVKENTKYKNFHKVTVNYTKMKYVKKTETKGKVLIKSNLNHIVV